MRLIDADELIKYLSPVAYENRIIKNDDFSYVMVSIMSQATIKAVPIEDLINTINIGIEATGNSDEYSAGMCNGLIWLKACYTEEEPNYVEAKQKSIPIEVLEELKAEIERLVKATNNGHYLLSLINHKISEVSKND